MNVYSICQHVLAKKFTLSFVTKQQRAAGARVFLYGLFCNYSAEISGRSVLLSQFSSQNREFIYLCIFLYVQCNSLLYWHNIVTKTQNTTHRSSMYRSSHTFIIFTLHHAWIICSSFCDLCN